MFEKTPSYTFSLLLLLLLFPLALVLITYINPNPNHFQLGFFSPNCPASGTTPPPTALSTNSNPEIKLLIGILTVPSKYERRNLIRMAYAMQQPIVNAQVDIRFVFCNLTSEEQKILISVEILNHRDIIILNCTENMDSGKTITYFSSLPWIFAGEERSYDYVMKADDDTYLRLDHVVDSLRDKPRKDLYWGLPYSGLPNLDESRPPYFVGMGYILSWDIVEWLALPEQINKDWQGAEDIILAKWLNIGNKGKNRYNMRHRMYNFHGVEAKDFLPDTIAVHLLKNDFTWAMTLKRFNVTAGLEPSRMYHL